MLVREGRQCALQLTATSNASADAPTDVAVGDTSTAWLAVPALAWDAVVTAEVGAAVGAGVWALVGVGVDAAVGAGVAGDGVEPAGDGVAGDGVEPAGDGVEGVGVEGVGVEPGDEDAPTPVYAALQLLVDSSEQNPLDACATVVIPLPAHRPEGSYFVDMPALAVAV